ncbi:hypothetical protein MUG91_G6n504 [Manis pentadactyla]|nr:hypothetical protein MUG91_G6n504 [Manis pentadactyla]
MSSGNPRDLQGGQPALDLQKPPLGRSTGLVPQSSVATTVSLRARGLMKLQPPSVRGLALGGGRSLSFWPGLSVQRLPGQQHCGGQRSQNDRPSRGVWEGFPEEVPATQKDETFVQQARQDKASDREQHERRHGGGAGRQWLEAAVWLPCSNDGDSGGDGVCVDGVAIMVAKLVVMAVVVVVVVRMVVMAVVMTTMEDLGVVNFGLFFQELDHPPPPCQPSQGYKKGSEGPPHCPSGMSQ